MKFNSDCDLLIGSRPENDSDNQYLECEDCRRYEVCKKWFGQKNIGEQP